MKQVSFPVTENKLAQPRSFTGNEPKIYSSFHFFSFLFNYFFLSWASVNSVSVPPDSILMDTAVCFKIERIEFENSYMN